MTTRRAIPLFCLLLLIAAGGWFAVRQPGPERGLEMGREALRRGDREDAERWALRLDADGHPDHALLLRAEVRADKGEAAAALAALEGFAGGGELRAAAVALRGRCYLDLGRLGDAERAFRGLLADDPDSLDAHRGLAAVYHDLGAVGDAVRHCRAWARLDDKDGRPHRFIGRMLHDLGDYDAAAVAYRDALGRELTNGARRVAQVELAECLFKLARYAPALEALDAAGDAPELAAKALPLRAACLRALARRDEALVVLSKALALKPVPPDALTLRGQMHLEAGEAGAAAALLERVVKVVPGDYTARHHLALAYTRLGRSDDAKAQEQLVKRTQDALEEMTQLTKKMIHDSRDPGLHLRRAELFERLWMPEEAARSRRNAALLGAGGAGGKGESR